MTAILHIDQAGPGTENEMFAFMQYGEDGVSKICAAKMEQGMLPMASMTRENINMFQPIVDQYVAQGVTIRLIRFEQMDFDVVSKLDEIVGYISVAENGAAGICACMSNLGAQPMIGTSLEAVEIFDSVVHFMREESEMDIHLVRFVQAEVLTPCH